MMLANVWRSCAQPGASCCSLDLSSELTYFPSAPRVLVPVGESQSEGHRTTSPRRAELDARRFQSPCPRDRAGRSRAVASGRCRRTPQRGFLDNVGRYYEPGKHPDRDTLQPSGLRCTCITPRGRCSSTMRRHCLVGHRPAHWFRGLRFVRSPFSFSGPGAPGRAGGSSHTALRCVWRSCAPWRRASLSTVAGSFGAAKPRVPDGIKNGFDGDLQRRPRLMRRRYRVQQRGPPTSGRPRLPTNKWCLRRA
jgi:hypothetical protein